MLMSKNENEIFSCSTAKFMFWCLEDLYSQNKETDSGNTKSTKASLTYCS